MEYRCPKHDIVFQTETDHTKPGTRANDRDGKPTGQHKHPQFGGVTGHPDCPLCAKAIKAHSAEITNWKQDEAPAPEPTPEPTLEPADATPSQFA